MDDDIAIKVDNVSKAFKLPHEKTTSIKSAVINFYRRKKTFEHQEAVKNVSFEVKKGDFFAIVGRNGSGKSTLLKMLAGIYSPNQGDVQINGKLTPFIELGVGFSPELTGRENVFLNGALLGFNRKEMEAMYQDIVDFAEIERFMDQRLKNYSSGMQVRLAFSIAIRAKSDILLLDEVLAVGDAAFQQKCYNYFEELKQQKKTVVFVSHDMSAVKRFCNKALFIENGVVKKMGRPEDVADKYIVDNIASENTAKDNKQTVSKFVKELNLELLSRNSLTQADHLNLRARYHTLQDFEVVLGVAIIKDGISVAEINSKAVKLESASNKVHVADLIVALRVLNPGLYSVNIALFNGKDMELLDYKINPVQFVITGDDETRGGAAYLAGGWKA